MNKFLILSYEFPPLVGGAGIYARELAIGLSRIGYEISVLSCYHKNKIVNEEIDKNILANNIKIQRFRPVGKLFFIQMLFHLRKNYGKDFQDSFDGIFLADIRAIKCAIIYFTDAQLSKSINIFHGGQVEYLIQNPNLLNRIFSIQKRFLIMLKKVKINLCVSNNLKESFMHELPDFDKYFKVVLHGIDTKIFHPISLSEKIIIRKKYGIPLDDIVLISPSRIVPGKGQDHLILAFNRIIQKKDKVTLLIAGDGSDRNRILNLISELNLNNKIIYLGELRRQELAFIFAASDLAIMLSRIPYEAFGLVNIEANACSIPVLASRIGGVQESVEDGVSGILVDPYDIDQIKDKLELMLNHEYLKRLGATAYERVCNHFTCENMALRTVEILKNLSPQLNNLNNNVNHWGY